MVKEEVGVHRKNCIEYHLKTGQDHEHLVPFLLQPPFMNRLSAI